MRLWCCSHHRTELQHYQTLQSSPAPNWSDFVATSTLIPASRCARRSLLTGSLRADQSIVLHRQDRRDLAVPGLPPSIWCRLHIGDADEFVWSPGTIVIGEQPRHADPSPALPRGEAEQRPDRDGTDKPLREFLFVDDLADTACSCWSITPTSSTSTSAAASRRRSPNSPSSSPRFWAIGAGSPSIRASLSIAPGSPAGDSSLRAGLDWMQ